MSDSKKKRKTMPAGYVSLTKIIGLTEGEISLLKSCGMTHGMKMPNDHEGRFDVGFYGFKGVRSKMKWHRYCGKGPDLGGWRYAIPPTGHISLEEIPNLDEKQRAFLRRRNMSYGMWMPDGRLEVSRFGGMSEKPEWQIFRGKIGDWHGWVGVKP